MHSRDPANAALQRLMAFAQAVKVRRMIEGIALEPKQTFWIMTVNLLLNSAAIEWCKVFVSWDEDTHWTKCLPKAEHDAVREKLLAATGLDQKEWEAYRDGIVGFRDQMVAHHDICASVAKYPQYDVAFSAADFMFSEIRSAADQDTLGGIPLSLDRWSRTLAGNMSAIVRTGFRASAELGSNVPS